MNRKTNIAIAVACLFAAPAYAANVGTSLADDGPVDPIEAVPSPTPTMRPLACGVGQAGCTTIWGGTMNDAGVAVGAPLYSYPRFPDAPAGAPAQLIGGAMQIIGTVTVQPEVTLMGAILGLIGTAQGVAAAPQQGLTEVTFHPASGMTGTVWMRIDLLPGRVLGGVWRPAPEGSCPQVDSFMADGRRARDVKAGDYVKTAWVNEAGEIECGEALVSYSETKMAPGVRVVTRSGVSLICSTTAPLGTDMGWVKAPEAVGQRGVVERGGEAGFDTFESVQDVGMIEVQHISLKVPNDDYDRRAFLCGEVLGALLLHHNKYDPGNIEGGQ